MKVIKNFAIREPEDVKPEILQYLKIIPHTTLSHFLNGFSPVPHETVLEILKAMVDEGLLENNAGKRGLRSSTRYWLSEAGIRQLD